LVKITTALIISGIMALSLSGFFVIYHSGWDGMFSKWMADFSLAWPIAFFLSLLIEGPVQTTVKKLLEG